MTWQCGCRRVMRARRVAAPDRHLLSVCLCTTSLCDTFSHIFTVKPFSKSRVLEKSMIISQLRMDGLLVLDLWDTVIEVLHSINNNVLSKYSSIQKTDTTLNSKVKTQRVKRRQKLDQLSDMENVSTNTHILFTMNLSCTSLKTTKPWSGW